MIFRRDKTKKEKEQELRKKTNGEDELEQKIRKLDYDINEESKYIDENIGDGENGEAISRRYNRLKEERQNLYKQLRRIQEQNKTI